jgi:outer membrane murein-binding lipoprotein Lpp
MSMAKKTKVFVGKPNVNGLCEITFDVPMSGYRAFLNTNPAMIASVAVSNEEIKINDCYKIAALDFHMEDYFHAIKSRADITKAHTKIAKEHQRLSAKVKKLKKAIDVLEENINARAEAVSKALAEADKQLSRVEIKKINVHEK